MNASIPSSELPLFDQLREIMRTLHDPVQGCAWDVQQTFATIAPYTIEEAYEVQDAILRGDRTALCAELGDLLLQVMFHSQMAEEEGSFTLDDVVRGIIEKMIRRHPHIFGSDAMRDAESQAQAWEAHKAQERRNAGHSSLMDDVPRNLPALVRAHKLQKRAAHVGFDWATITPVWEKVHEELAELHEAHISRNHAHTHEELGDLLFVLVNLAHHMGCAPDDALHAANHKFEQRFRAMEAMAHSEGTSLANESLTQQEARWQKVKRL
ncbi:MAG: nucleoside triphosphate pyrophosphohydrolase [Alphaproteobacteria bacterium]|nr:MAG: nucleoside triphosphate pyrophosphohydrolase [Alphaproteobacteria bacterium]